MLSRGILTALSAAGLMLMAGAANATSVTINGSAGARSASAAFAVSGSNLQITLTNTASADAMAPTDILTAIYFDISGSLLGLGRGSVVLAPGSTVYHGITDPGNVVGGEWAYVEGLGGAPSSARYGVSSSGLNWFGPSDRFPGNDLEPPVSPDGVQYGITTAGDDMNTGNGGIDSSGLIHNSVVVTLTGLPAGFDPLSRISNLTFQYGTAVTEPQVPGNPGGSVSVPLPSAAGAGLATIGLVLSRRRRR